MGTIQALGRAQTAAGGAGQAAILVVSAPAGGPAGGARIDLDPASRDWRAARTLVLDVTALSPGRIRVRTEHAGGQWTWYLLPKPGLRHRVAVLLQHLQERPPNTSHPGYFTFGGGPDPVALHDVRSLAFEYDQPGPAVQLEIAGIRLERSETAPAVLNSSVVVDRFGQWLGAGGRPRTEAEIRRAWESEPTEARPLPGRSRYGGDSRRRLKATGYFRVAQQDGRWLLVDPEGCPFFSIGATCVRSAMPGPVQGRESLFEALPSARERVAGGPWSGEHADFYRCNLERRYGTEWFAAWAAQQGARLVRWGFNTIANWSEEKLCALGRIPYTDRLKGVDPLCQAVPDVFDPALPARVRAAIEPEMAPRQDDPMLIGYFVGNEPKWMFPGAAQPFQIIFQSDQHPHTRAEAVRWLQQRYADIAALNAAWATGYAAWDQLAQQGVPDPRTGSPALKEAAAAFTGHLLSRFYRVICEAARSIDPNHLLLGARFYTTSLPDAYISACRPFDVFSFNCYRPTAPKHAVERVLALAGIPSLIGEFHFGEVGNGRSGALISVLTQKERGEAYRRYVLDGAAQPGIVGLHWFQWLDEPVTGRFDGEDYNCGLVDMQDIPYADMLADVVDAHRHLYATALPSNAAS